MCPIGSADTSGMALQFIDWYYGGGLHPEAKEGQNQLHKATYTYMELQIVIGNHTE